MAKKKGFGRMGTDPGAKGSALSLESVQANTLASAERIKELREAEEKRSHGGVPNEPKKELLSEKDRFISYAVIAKVYGPELETMVKKIVAAHAMNHADALRKMNAIGMTLAAAAKKVPKRHEKKRQVNLQALGLVSGSPELDPAKVLAFVADKIGIEVASSDGVIEPVVDTVPEPAPSTAVAVEPVVVTSTPRKNRQRIVENPSGFSSGGSAVMNDDLGVTYPGRPADKEALADVRSAEEQVARLASDTTHALQGPIPEPPARSGLYVQAATDGFTLGPVTLNDFAISNIGAELVTDVDDEEHTTEDAEVVAHVKAWERLMKLSADVFAVKGGADAVSLGYEADDDLSTLYGAATADLLNLTFSSDAYASILNRGRRAIFGVTVAAQRDLSGLRQKMNERQWGDDRLQMPDETETVLNTLEEAAEKLKLCFSSGTIETPTGPHAEIYTAAISLLARSAATVSAGDIEWDTDSKYIVDTLVQILKRLVAVVDFRSQSGVEGTDAIREAADRLGTFAMQTLLPAFESVVQRIIDSSDFGILNVNDITIDDVDELDLDIDDDATRDADLSLATADQAEADRRAAVLIASAIDEKPPINATNASMPAVSDTAPVVATPKPERQFKSPEKFHTWAQLAHAWKPEAGRRLVFVASKNEVCRLLPTPNLETLSDTDSLRLVPITRGVPFDYPIAELMKFDRDAIFRPEETRQQALIDLLKMHDIQKELSRLIKKIEDDKKKPVLAPIESVGGYTSDIKVLREQQADVSDLLEKSYYEPFFLDRLTWLRDSIDSLTVSAIHVSEVIDIRASGQEIESRPTINALMTDQKQLRVVVEARMKSSDQVPVQTIARSFREQLKNIRAKITQEENIVYPDDDSMTSVQKGAMNIVLSHFIALQSMIEAYTCIASEDIDLDGADHYAQVQFELASSVAQYLESYGTSTIWTQVEAIEAARNRDPRSFEAVMDANAVLPDVDAFTMREAHEDPESVYAVHEGYEFQDINGVVCAVEAEAPNGLVRMRIVDSTGTARRMVRARQVLEDYLRDNGFSKSN